MRLPASTINVGFIFLDGIVILRRGVRIVVVSGVLDSEEVESEEVETGRAVNKEAGKKEAERKEAETREAETRWNSSLLVPYIPLCALFKLTTRLSIFFFLDRT
jgi:hypothetical protein